MSGLDRFVERGDQFQAFAPLKTIYQCRTLVDETIDDVLIIGLMTKAVDIRRIDRKLFNHLLVRGEFVDETPVPDLIDGKARDFNRTLLPQDRERTFEIGWARGGRGLDNSQRAVAEF